MARAAQLAASGKLRRGAGGALAWSQPHSPAARVGLRSASAESFVIADGRDGTVLGTIERERVFRAAHPGAVYLHLGESYLVRHLDLDAASVVVEPFCGAYYTQAKVEKHVAIAGAGDAAAARRRRRPVVRHDRGDRAGRRLPEARPRGRRSDRHGHPRPARAGLHDRGALVHPAARAAAALAGRRAPSSAPCTPPSTPASPSCRSTPCATAGTSAACRRPGTGRPTSPPSSSTTATPAASASRGAPTRPSTSSSPTPRC